MKKNIAYMIFLMVFISSCNKESHEEKIMRRVIDVYDRKTGRDLTELRIEINCIPEGFKFNADFYVDDDFIGSKGVNCGMLGDDAYFTVKLNQGVHNIMISNNNVKLYRKEIRILGTDSTQTIVADFLLK